MNPDTHSWKRFAAAVRQLDAGAGTAPVAEDAIPWLPDFSGQVHALLLRLIWKRWALGAIAVSFAVLLAFFLASRPAAPAVRVPRIPVPSAP